MPAWCWEECAINSEDPAEDSARCGFPDDLASTLSSAEQTQRRCPPFYEISRAFALWPDYLNVAPAAPPRRPDRCAGSNVLAIVRWVSALPKGLAVIINTNSVVVVIDKCRPEHCSTLGARGFRILRINVALLVNALAFAWTIVEMHGYVRQRPTVGVGHKNADRAGLRGSVGNA